MCSQRPQTGGRAARTALFLLFATLGLSSCVSMKAPGPVTVAAPAPRLPLAHRENAYHSVAPGETIWRISQMYDVPVATILQANGLRRESPLLLGQTLFIPRAAPLKPVISMFPSTKWRYIVIHHSATEEGNSLAFHRAHLSRGWDRGVGYHFVIDNGTDGKQDGQIEVTPRWIKQEDGAHCKAGDMNVKGIGICLVGNFNVDEVSNRQMESLVSLVDKLQKYYHIPDSHIIGHRDAPGATTECPGAHFPWAEFLRRLRRGY